MLVTIPSQRVSTDGPYSIYAYLTKDSGYGLSFMRARSYFTPEIERPEIDDHVGLWLPYPNCEPSMRVHFGKFADYQFNLHEVGAEVGSFVFCNDRDPSNLRGKLSAIEAKLATLHQSLPCSDENTTINPQIMDLQ